MGLAAVETFNLLEFGATYKLLTSDCMCGCVFLSLWEYVREGVFMVLVFLCKFSDVTHIAALQLKHSPLALTLLFFPLTYFPHQI